MKSTIYRCKPNHRCITLIVSILTFILLGYKTYTYFDKKIICINLGVFAGSYWDVPIQDSNQFFDEIIREFEEQNPGIKIKYRSGILKRDYSEWLSQNIIKGTEPDIFCILPNDFNTLSSIGMLKDLDNIIEKDNEFDKNNIYLNAVKSGQFKGKQYALPIEVSPVLMFVNKTLLQKEGISIPNSDWTWKDFYTICERVTKDIDGDGRLDQFGSYGFTWQDAVYSNGQTLFDENGSIAYFDKNEIVEAVQFVKKINNLNMNEKVSSKDFDMGKVAFRPFLFSTYKAYKPYPYRVKKYSQFEWECIKLPKGPKGNNASELHSFLVGISSRTKNEKEVWKFMKHLIGNKETQTKLLKHSYGIPALRYITESEIGEQLFSKISPEENFINKTLLSEVIEQSIVIPRFQRYERLIDMADKEIYQIISMDKEIEESLRKLNKEINNIIKNN